MTSPKTINTVVLDTGAIIRNEPPVSVLLTQCESLTTIPEIISEIKDSVTRSRFDTTLRPFLSLRSPGQASVKFVTDFARRTGDLAVLSKADIQIIALTYELECEKNGGDWRLRRIPGQKRVNGAPPAKTASGGQDVEPSNAAVATPQNPSQALSDPEQDSEQGPKELTPAPRADDSLSNEKPVSSDGSTQATSEDPPDADLQGPHPVNDITNALAESRLTLEHNESSKEHLPKVDSPQNSPSSQDDSDAGSGSDSEGWITPSNLKKKQAEDSYSSASQASEPKTMQVAVLTTDFAMQNVILQINLNLISPSLNRVSHLKTFVLRCHACFQTTKAMDKQFCPKCGQPTLTRVSCSTNANGEFKLHLKKNMQWNHRGDRYSIPKPVHGSAHGRIKGGGKSGWGNDLILAEDQKEYVRAITEEKRRKDRSLMDEDYLPGILTGDRGRAGGRIKVGAGRNVNAKKR